MYGRRSAFCILINCVIEINRRPGVSQLAPTNYVKNASVIDRRRRSRILH